MRVNELFEDKKPRNKLEAFVKPYIEQLVGKKAGASVDIPYTVKDWEFNEVRNAISLWMGRLITKGETGKYSISYVKNKNHFTITLK